MSKRSINRFLLLSLMLCLIDFGFLHAQNVGIGTATPVSKLDVNGNLVVGTTYSGTSAAPLNGAIIEGDVGVGTATPTAKLDVEGTWKLGTGGDVNNGLYTLVWAWGAQNVNTAGLRIRLTGTNTVLGIPSDAHVHISFLGVQGAGGGDGIGPDIYLSHAWMEADAVGFWLKWDGAFGSYAISNLSARYTFIW